MILGKEKGTEKGDCRQGAQVDVQVQVVQEEMRRM